MQKFKALIKEIVRPLFSEELCEFEQLKLASAEALASSNKALDKLKEENDKLLNLIPEDYGIDVYCTKHFKVIPNKAYKQKRKINGKYYSIFLNELITPDSFEVLKFKRGLEFANNMLTNAKNVGNKVAQYLTWKDDINLDNSGDYYLYPNETLCLKFSDCIAEYEQIRTQDGLKTAKELKLGDKVLSYDFDKSEYCWKPIINKWDKGKLKVYRIFFMNGTWIDVTKNHHMAVRDNPYTEKIAKSRYVKKELKHIDLNSKKSWDKKVPCAIKTPYTIKDIEWLDEDLCFVLGHFFAEGYKRKSHIETSGHQIYDYICPILDKKGIPYKIRINNSNCPILIFKDSKFRDYLKTLKMGSFDIEFPNEFMYLPETKIRALIDGYFLGDGHYHYRRNVLEKIYSTSSDNFAKQLQIMSLHIGSPLYLWKQINHGGIGNKPIWRLYDYPNSYFKNDYGHKDMSETSILKIEEIGEFNCFDWEVKDTHIFFFANGIATFQCEDHSFLVASLYPEFGVAYGSAEGIGWHAFNVFVYKDKLYVLDTVGDSANTGLLSKMGYKINYIITKNNTYEVDGSVEFGKIAGWMD